MLRLLRVAIAGLLVPAFMAGAVVQAQTPPTELEDPNDVADPVATYQRGVSLYEHGEYAEAARTFRSVLEPLLLTDVETIKKARVYRGICLYLTGEKKRSESEFFSVLLLDPQYNLDPLFTPPAIIDFFNDIRRRRAAELAKLRPGNGNTDDGNEVNPRTGRKRETDPDVSAGGDFLLTLTPLGVGQIHNAQPVKGYVIMGTEVTLLVANLTTFAILNLLENEDGTFPDQVIPRARLLRGVNLISFSALIAAIVYGVVDALWYRYGRASEPEEEPDGSMSPASRPQISIEIQPGGGSRPATTYGARLEFRF